MEWLIILAIFAVASTSHLAQAEKCLTPNNEPAECVSLYSCPILVNIMLDPSCREFIKQSTCGGSVMDPMVCCGTSSNFTSKPEPPTPKPPKKKLNFGKLVASKAICGFQHSDDYAHTQSGAVITQFPWMALIEYHLENDTDAIPPGGKYFCSGSIISQKYVLTAAQCFFKHGIIPVAVRLGEFHLKNDTDCMGEIEQMECSDAATDFKIETLIPHPDYDEEDNRYDIGLIRLKGKAKYSDYIRPICLPIYSKKKPKPGNTLITSGWGKKDHENYTNVETKKLTYTTLLSNEECSQRFENDTEPLTGRYMCGQLSNEGDSVCDGDEGGPVMYRRKQQWYQVAVVSYGWCKSDLPEIFTNVDHYLDWIKENLKP